MPDEGEKESHVGPWHLGKTLGRGSNSLVRLARHSTTGQVAAVKIVSIKKAGGQQYFTKKKRPTPWFVEGEITIMKLIKHPNITRLYDVWRSGEELYVLHFF